jgi:putative transposase
MKKSKFSEEQIVRILREIEAGAKVKEICRTHGISEPTYYAWKNKYVGTEVSRLRHLKGVEVELARLRRMYVELALERHAPAGVLSRKAWAGRCKPNAAGARQADRVSGLARSARLHRPLGGQSRRASGPTPNTASARCTGRP